MTYNGYAGSILRIDLSNGRINKLPTLDYAELFLGGRGIAAKIYWDEVPPDSGPFDPENRLVFMTGPVCGVPGFAGSRWQVCGKSPITNRFGYCNLGGSWGAQLKASGHDGLVVQGKADKLVYLWINDDHVEIRDASRLAGKGAISSREELKRELGESARVVAEGAAGENMVSFATLLADADSSGSSGLGAVMGAKNLKAIVVKGQSRTEVASPEAVQDLRSQVRHLKGDALLILPILAPSDRLKKDVCYGCINGCMRNTYTMENGQKGKFMCGSALFYSVRAQRYYGETTDVPFQANKLCDEYGLATYAMETMIMWLSRCYQSKVLSEEETGIPLSKIGSLEFIQALARIVSLREGFGGVLADGTRAAARSVGAEAENLITDYMTKYGTYPIYGPRMYVTTGLIYAMEPRLPIQQLHEISMPSIGWVASSMGMGDPNLNAQTIRAIGERFWGSEVAADFSTYDGKAAAAARIQERQYAKERLILCDFAWPIIYSPATEDHVGDPGIESRIYSAVTGRDVDELGLYKIAERVFNLQRAILVREGHRGRDFDSLEDFHHSVPLKMDFVGNPNCLVPGKGGEAVSRKGSVVNREQFERMKDEYYAIRGWDIATGLQRKDGLRQLGLEDVAQELEVEGLLG
ncbi:MAG: aldehyde ferredoxin oxidoreductase N-terminal domain-containing protein [Chloroflexota bacterium]|nr:aldehyde ferredoxin oxidoreductase N-terminal domain-containing protein [Chloroflexota bacterium]